MFRKALTPLVVSLILASSIMAGPAAAAPWNDPADTITQATYGADSTPSWIVEVEGGELGTLSSWAAGSDERQVLREHNGSNTAVVTASPAAVGDRWRDAILGNGLKSKSYVVGIRPNYKHSLLEPVNPENKSLVDAPSRSLRTFATLGSAGGAGWSQSGVAYADTTNESTLSDVRDVTGVSNVSATGDGATIAVIDSGVNEAGGEVLGNGSSASEPRILPESKDFITNETVADEGYDAVEDPVGHGTWVASAAAANVSGTTHDGMAPNADILALRTLDESGQGSTADIAAAVRYAADHEGGVDAIVMSLGSPVYDAELTSALEYAVDHNVSAIAIATGNSRQTTRWIASPADVPVPGVTAVSATNTSSNTTAGTAYFANVGSDPATTDLSGGETAGQDVDVSAPGLKINATVATTSGTTQYETLSGTSMAAPHVAGIAALGVETNEDWTGDAEAFNENVSATARPMPNAAAIEVGQGMVAADRLLADETDGDQTAAMDGEASARDEFWRGLSETSPWLNPISRIPVIS